MKALAPRCLGAALWVGAACGAIAAGALAGKVADVHVYDTELAPADVAALARTPP